MQTAFRNVFSAFQTTGSAYGVVKFFVRNSFLFPKRAYGGVLAGKLVWGTLTHGRVLGMLKNPVYTGAYVFGRYKYRKCLDANGLFKYQVVRLPQDLWEVLIFNHYPEYISWSQYEDNLKQLEQNRTNAEVSGLAREGWALQGILICGRCCCRMTIRYTGNCGIEPRYECRRRWEPPTPCWATCWTMPSRQRPLMPGLTAA